MNTFIKNISIERLDDNDAKEMIESFVSLGWEYNGYWNLSTHIFAKLIWDKDTEPIYPQGYQ